MKNKKGGKVGAALQYGRFCADFRDKCVKFEFNDWRQSSAYVIKYI